MIKYFKILCIVCALSLSASADDSTPSSSAPKAEESTSSSAPSEQPQASAAPKTEMPPIPASVIKAGEVAAKYDWMGFNWWSIPFTGAGTAVCQDCAIRRTLAEHNIGFFLQEMSTGDVNLRHSAVPQSAGQVFDGQKATYFTAVNAYMSYNIPSKRLQFFTAAQTFQTTWAPDGPTFFRLHYYGISERFLKNDKLVVTAGQWDNDIAFYEGYVGGNMAGGVLGQSAAIPYLVGQSRAGLSSPAIMIDYKFGNSGGGVGFTAKGAYNRFAIQRSTDPWGAEADHHSNPKGTRFTWKDLKPVFIDEIGYHRPASPEKRDIFVRATGWYNMTSYPDYRTLGYGNLGPNGPGTGSYSKLTDFNWATSLAGDVQLLKTNKYLAYQGLYLGASAQYAPPEQNLFTQYYELRAYKLAPLKSRPFDMCTFDMYHIDFSKAYERGMLRAGLSSDYPPAQLAGMADSLLVSSFYGDQTAVGVNYTAMISPGVFFSPTIMYVRHGAPGPRSAGSPVVAKIGINLFLF